MKNLLFLLAFTAACPASGQDTTGTIRYRRTIKINLEAASLDPEIARLLPPEQTSEKELLFSPQATLYRNLEDPQAGDDQTYQPQENMTIRVQVNTPDEQTLTDLKQNRQIAQKDLLGRVFLVNSELKPLTWKPTGRQKLILDMPCMEAVCIRGGDTVTAWYTTAIPVSSGPMELYGLPGLILEASVGAQVQLVATEIRRGEIASNRLKAPSKGKKISAADWEQLVRKKQEEQGQPGGSKGIMIHRHITR